MVDLMLYPSGFCSYTRLGNSAYYEQCCAYICIPYDCTLFGEDPMPVCVHIYLLNDFYRFGEPRWKEWRTVTKRVTLPASVGRWQASERLGKMPVIVGIVWGKLWAMLAGPPSRYPKCDSMFKPCKPSLPPLPTCWLGECCINEGTLNLCPMIELSSTINSVMLSMQSGSLR